MEEFLVRRLDRPLAWLAAFGIPALFGGALAGITGALPGGILGGAAICGSAVGLVGLFFGLIAWVICRLIGGLDQPVRRPDRWAQAYRCVSCDWKTSPEGPVTRRDCTFGPEACPACGAGVIPLIPDCPHCHASIMKGDGIAKDMLRLVRWPRTFGQAFLGHYRCPTCEGEYDRWGRAVVNSRICI